jgi:hypothetical protein
MKGRIEALRAGVMQGQILAEDGSRVSFEMAGILAYDVGRLSVGHTVTFDFDRRRSTAVNVSRDQQHPFPLDRRVETQVRYLGFEQNNGVRTYRFERSLNGEPALPVVITADLRLFSKHHVAIQEGPAICLRLISHPSPAVPVHHDITEDDMLAFLASRAAVKSHRTYRPFRRK